MFARTKFAGLAIAAALTTTAATLASAGSPAYAAEPGVQQQGAASARVRHLDLNLATASGLSTLEERVSRAAKRLCTERGSPPLQARKASRACIADAVADASPQVRLAVARQRQAQFASRASAGK